MRVFDRKVEEGLRIFEDGSVKLKILKVKGKKRVDIGIQAPKHIKVTREEIFTKSQLINNQRRVKAC